MERVVLLDELGRDIGSADKATVHDRDTPLHLAFSCYLFNPAGQLLLTRRARSKRTWPGVVTNSCCGHPAPGESMADAVVRRLHDELGVDVGGVELLLPRFRYRAVMANGVVENELCPVFRAVIDAVTAVTALPDPAEVDFAGWLDWPLFLDLATAGDLAVSPWCAEQLPQLSALGPDPLAWPVADTGQLPPAATG